MTSRWLAALSVAACGGGGGGGDGGGGPEVTSCTETACAFPGAEGFGTATPGGRGGRVIAVTTLAPSGAGSLTEALLATGPRIIVFRVSGVIDFAGATVELTEEQSFVTVAGQTSPGGITLKNVTLSAYHAGFHDGVFRFLRFRGNDVGDNLSFATVHHIVIDHVDFAGATDECFDVTSGNDITVQWSTITNSVSGPGSQNYGALIAYKPTTRISWHHNFSAHHLGRCGAQLHWNDPNEPDPPDGAWLDVRNNAYYNCGFQQLVRGEVEPATGTRYNFVGNYAKSGPNTPAESMMWGVGGTVHMADNVYEGQQHIMSPFFDGTLTEAPHPFATVTTTTAAKAWEDVLAWAGSWPRDALMTRTVTEARTGTGQLGKLDDALLTSTAQPPADADLDGMPDAWETAKGLSPNDPSDASAPTANGYTQVEVYLAERAAQVVGS